MQKAVSAGNMRNARQKKYEDYAYVLDFDPNGTSRIIKGKNGPLIRAVGERNFAFLEILVRGNHAFVSGDRIAIGKKNRELDLTVHGKLEPGELTGAAKINLNHVAQRLVVANRKRFEQMLSEDYFPRNKLGLTKGKRFDTAKFGKRLAKELLGQTAGKEILLSKNGWFYPRRAVGWAAAYAKALGGGPVGDSRYLGGTAPIDARVEEK